MNRAARAALLVFAGVAPFASLARANESEPRCPYLLALAHRVPEELRGSLESCDPTRLADTRLPRLASLTLSEREGLAAAVASWPAPRRVAAFAFLQVGSPYVNGPLGEGVPPDTDPLIRFDVADCATLNLVSEALAHAREAGGEREAMTRVGYRRGRVSYADRLHFTTDRIDANPWETDITRAVGGRATRSQTILLNRKRDGSRWIPIPWSRRRAIHWIPIDTARNFPAWAASGRLPEAVGVAFVQRAKLADGLDVVHESLLWNGRVLLHGSSRIGRVVTVDWNEFLRERGPLYDGLVLFEYR